MSVKATLEPTSALVIDLASKYYSQDKLTAAFLELVETSSGQAMIDGYKSAGIYELTQEVISHRKYIIKHAVLDAVEANEGKSQVLILAAGKAPLALELLSTNSKKIEKIYEVDVSSFDVKKTIYTKLAPELCTQVVFCESDIRSKNLIGELEKIGFQPALHTVLVVEGITHYMSVDELKSTLAPYLDHGKAKRTIVVDFGPPYETLTARIQPTAREAYRIIEDNCYLKPMTKYTEEQMTALFKDLGCSVAHHYTIHDIEKLRTGENQFFPEKKSAWLEYMVACN